MSKAASITFGFPCCYNVEGKESSSSFYSRIATLVIGIITACAGIYYPGCLGWSLFAGGTLLTFVALTIKCVKKESQIENKPSLETPSDGSFFSLASSIALVGNSETQPFEFSELPNELKLAILNQCDPETLFHLAHTDRTNADLVRSDFRDKITEARWKEHAFRAWTKSSSTNADIFFAAHVDELIPRYTAETIRVLEKRLSEIEEMPKTAFAQKAFTYIASTLIALAQRAPSEASHLVYRARDLVLMNPNDNNICSCAEALFAIDPDGVFPLIESVKDTRSMDEIVVSFIKGSKDLNKCLEEVFEIQDEDCKIEALISIIEANCDRKPVPSELCDILPRALDMTVSLPNEQPNLFKHKLLAKVGQVYLALKDLDKALEIFNRISIDDFKEDYLCFIVDNYDCQNEDLKKILDLLSGVKNYKDYARFRIAKKIYQTDVKWAEEIFKEILASKEAAAEKDLALHMLVKFYAPLDLFKASDIASRIHSPQTRIEAILSIVSESKNVNPIFLSALLDAAILRLPLIKEKEEAAQNYLLPRMPVRIKAICLVARHCMAINPEKGLGLLKMAEKEIDAHKSFRPYPKGVVIPELASVYAMFDFQKARSLIQNAFGQDYAAQASAYLKVAQYSRTFGPVVEDKFIL